MEVKEAPLNGSWPSNATAAIDQTLRRGRVIEARRLALETSRATQAAYRDALVREIEGELFQRKARWEASRAARLAALQAVYSQSLVMIGEAQKAAVEEVASDLSAAVSQTTPWAALAATTVRRGLEAAAAEDRARLESMQRGASSAVYRSEVSRAAAAEERALAAAAAAAHRRAAGGGTPRGGSAGSSRRGSSATAEAGAGAGAAPTHPLVPPGALSGAAAPSRLSPFYGPRATAGLAATTDPASGRTLVGGIPRVPLGGPLSCATSAARLPYLAHRAGGEEAGEEGRPGSAQSAAAASAAALAQARSAAVLAREEAGARASRRGSTASAALREPREALMALECVFFWRRPWCCLLFFFTASHFSHNAFTPSALFSFFFFFFFF